MKQLNMLCKILGCTILVTILGAILVLNNNPTLARALNDKMLHIANELDAKAPHYVAPPTTVVPASYSAYASSGWDIDDQQDKFTDNATLTAQKVFQIDGGGRIDAKLTCEDGVEFSFSYFDDSIPQPAFVRTSNMVGLNAVVVLYRLDSGKIRSFPSVTKYVNQAKIEFDTKADTVKAVVPYGGNPNNYETLESVLQAKLLRVKLPLQGRDPFAISIPIDELNEFWQQCPYVQAAKANSAGSSAVATTGKIPNANKNEPAEHDEIITPNSSSQTKDTALSNSGIQSGECQKANKTSVDILMCSNASLVIKDRRVQNAYMDVRQRAGKNDGQIVEDQEQWLAARAQKCGLNPFADIDESESNRLIDCFGKLYDERLNQLESKMKVNHVGQVVGM